MRTLGSVLVLCLTSMLFATSYDISRYIEPNYQSWKLTLSTSSSAYSEIGASIPSMDAASDWEAYGYSAYSTDKGLLPHLTLGFPQYIYHTDDLDIQGSVTATDDYVWGKSESSSKNHATTQNFSVAAQLSADRYLNSPFFVGAAFSGSYSKYYHRTEYEDSIGTDARHSWYEKRKLTMGVRTGYGKLRDVDDAWVAVMLIEELQRQGMLLQTPSDEVINELATLITQTRTQKSLDARETEKRQLIAITHFMTDHELCANSVEAIAVLDDIWRYHAAPSNFTWQSGTKVTLSYTPTLSGELQWEFEESGSQAVKETQVNHKLALNVIQALPLSAHWQRTLALQAGVAYIDYWKQYPIINAKAYDYNHPNKFLLTSAGMVYRPDTRNMFTFYGVFRYDDIDNNYDVMDNAANAIRTVNTFWRCYFPVTWNYQIVPNLNLTLKYQYLFGKYHWKQSDNYEDDIRTEFISHGHEWTNRHTFSISASYDY